MQRVAHTFAVCLLWGALSGLGVGVASVLAERYVRSGLHRLALHVLADALWAYTAAALAGGVVAVALRALATPVASRIGDRLQRFFSVGCWLAVALAPWLLLPFRDRALLPPGRSGALAFGVVLGCVQTVFWLWFWRAGRRGARGRGVTAAFAASLVLLLTIWGLDRSGIVRHRMLGPNIVLVVMDTVRADRLSVYGYDRPTSPELEAFARGAIRFQDFYSTASWTLPSHASLFTGLYSVRHRATNENLLLERSFTTLAEIFRDRGYTTWGVSANPHVSRGFNMSQGFETFVETWRDNPRHGSRSWDALHPNSEAFEGFLDARDERRPFFAFLNYMDAHSPYLPPEPERRRFLRGRVAPQKVRELVNRNWTEFYVGRPYTPRDLRILSDLYDGEIAYLSRALGALLARLERDGRFADTLIVITSDHGEHFGENGLLGHEFGLYNTTVRVPLLVRLPGGARGGIVDSRPGQLLDLFPTLLVVAGIEVPVEHQGRDLLSASASGRRAIFSEYYYPAGLLQGFTDEQREQAWERLEPYRRRLRAIQTAGFRLIWSSRGNHELYEIGVDPGERNNLLAARDENVTSRALLADLRELVEAHGGAGAFDEVFDAENSAGGPPHVDDETRDHLRALGYVR